jgi:Protein kinase domain
MGAVFVVVDPRTGRRMALKLLPRGAFQVAGQRERFAQEAQLLARVRHRHVVAVHDKGEDPAGPYLVMDLVAGRPLNEVFRRGPLAPREAVRIALALAGGLAAAHAEGVLHRDLKPHNVVLRPDGEPVLLDFGLARTIGAAGLTKTGALLGTPAFMAPEQAAGDSTRALDERTDVYGLGTILFCLAAGRAPFSGSSISTVNQVLHHDPEWPTDLPPALLAILRRCMAKEREERYPSMRELGQDLERFLAGEAGAQPGRPRRHVVLGLAACGVVAGLAAVALGGARSQPDSSSSDADQASVSPPVDAAPTPAPAPEDPRGYRPLAHEDGEPDHVKARFLGSDRVLTWGSRRDLSQEGYLALWDVTCDPPRALRRWKVEGSIDALDVVGPSGPVLICVGSRQRAQLLQIPDLEQEELVVLADLASRARALAVYPEGTRAVVVPWLNPSDPAQPVASFPTLLDLATGRTVHRLQLIHLVVYDVVLLPDGRIALATGSDGRGDLGGAGSGLVLWDPEARTTIPAVSITPLRTLLLDPDGESVWIGSEDYRAGRYKLARLHLGLRDSLVGGLEGTDTVPMEEQSLGLGAFRSPAHSGQVRDFARFGGRLYSCSAPEGGAQRRGKGKSEVRAWDAETQTELFGVVDWPHPPVSLDASPDGRWLLVGLGNGARQAELWRVERLPQHGVVTRASLE